MFGGDPNRPMTGSQFSEWIEYYRLEPWGDRREYERTALLACILANAYRRKNARAFRIEDFMPPPLGRAPERAQSAEEMAKILKGMAAGARRRKELAAERTRKRKERAAERAKARAERGPAKGERRG